MTPDLMVRNPVLTEIAHANGNGHAHENVQAAVLTSWKDIARYMGKGVRTVQRWEQDFGLPVRRPQGSNKKAILARPRDLDAWIAMRCQSRATMEIQMETLVDQKAAHARHRISTLHAEVETSRMLRQSNRELIREVSAALEELRASIVSIGLKGR